MKKYTYLFLFSIFMVCFVACNSEPTQQTTNSITENLSESQIDSVLNQFQFEYENPIFIENSDEILLPIKTSLAEDKTSSRKYSSYSSSEEENRFITTWNILFYNKAKGKE